MSFCPNCGRQTIPGDFYCECCGIRYDQSEGQPGVSNSETAGRNIGEGRPAKKSGRGFRIFFILILLISLSAGAYYIKINKLSNTGNRGGQQITQPVEQPLAEKNVRVQPDPKPAEIINKPVEPETAPAAVKKNDPLQASGKPGSVATSKNASPAKTPDARRSVVVFSTWNNNGLLLNNPIVERIKWNVTKPVMITRVTTYHWNGGKGDSGGGTLTFSGTKDFGPYRVVRMEAGDDGTANAKWVFEPDILLSPGKYKIEQTGKRTLSHNVGSGGQGFVKVEGYYTGQ